MPGSLNKLKLLVWKNYTSHFVNFRKTMVVILTPTFFCIFFVIFRWAVNVEQRSAQFRAMLDPNKNWQLLQAEIERRHEVIVNATGKDINNVFMPQIIIAYSPSDMEAVRNIMERAVNTEFPNIKLKAFKTCEDLKRAMNDQFYLAGVCFFDAWPPSYFESRVGIYPKHLEFTLVYPSELRLYNNKYISSVWDVNRANFWRSPNKHLMEIDLDGRTDYVSEGAILLQKAISAAFIDLINTSAKKLPDVVLLPFPEREHVIDDITNNFDMTLPFFILVSHLPPMLHFLKYVLDEKESVIELLMDILYVNRTLQFCGWILTCFPMMCAASILSLSLLKIHWNEGHAVLTHTPLTALILIFMLYNISSLCFCYMLTNFFTNTSVGIGVISLIWFLSHLPYVLVDKHDEVCAKHTLFSLYFFPNSILGLVFRKIRKLENSGNGLKWDLLKLSDDSVSEVSISMLFFIFIAHAFGYAFLALFASQISFSNQFGERMRHLYKRLIPRRERHPTLASHRTHSRTEIHEIDPLGKSVIQFTNVSLTINDVSILNNVTFTVYEGEFIMLMGHNGAGKTSLFQIAIGLREPTEGTVTMHKYNAQEERNPARTSLGVCVPEMLFDELTIENQLWFFARLRGFTEQQARDEAEKYLKAMESTGRRHILTRDLTRGMRQYLAVCCSLVGGTKVVLLDEPSSKIDMTSRKQLWNLLHEERKNRTILMITQSGLEADMLADRIIMLSNGAIRCGGSPYFLKHLCGSAYRVTMNKKPECTSENVTKLMRKYIPHLSPESDFGAELSYLISTKYVDIMGSLLHEISENYEVLGLDSCTLNEMTLDDVFYNFGAEYSADGNRHLLTDMMNGKSIYDNEYEKYLFLDVKHELHRQWLYGFCAMIYKDFLYFQTQKIPLILCILTSILSVIVSLITAGTYTFTVQNIQFKLKHYPASTIVMGRTQLGSEFIKTIEDEYLQIISESFVPHRHTDIYAGDFADFIHREQNDDVFLTSTPYLFGVTFAEHQIGAYYNNFALNSAPLSLNMAYNAILRTLLNSDGRIVVKLEVLPCQSDTALLLTKKFLDIGPVIATNLAFCACYVGSLGIFFQVREQKTRFKFIQLISGLSPVWYWISMLISYVIQTIFGSILLVLTIFLLDNKIFSMCYVVVSCFLITVLTSIALVSINHVIAKPFTDEIAAYIAVTTFHAFGCFGFCLYVNLNDKVVNLSMDWFLRIFPLFSFSSALINLYFIGVKTAVCNDAILSQMSIHVEKCKRAVNCCAQRQLLTFDGGILDDVTYLIVIAVVSWIVTFILDSKIFLYCSKVPNDHTPTALIHHKRIHGTPPYPPIEDDVIYEQIATEVLSPRDIRSRALVCKRVGKFYDSKAAVNRLTFQLQSSDCLALLGPNGSGKSTLLSIIVGEKRMSYGSAYIKNADINKNPSTAMKYIGYSASSNTLILDFSIYETMKLICMILCMEYREILPVCENLAKVLGFYTYFGIKLKHCSKGILMRVHFAIAILKRPKLLCLDFPTASVDLTGQRMLWNVINCLRRKGTAVIFTSLTMLECLAHSTKVAVMYGGAFDIIVPTFELSKKHEYVYCVYCKMKRPTISNRKYYLKFFFNLTTFMEKNYPTSILSESFCNMVVFLIPIADASVGEIFEKFNHNYFDLNLETYFITRETLTRFYLDSVEKDKKIGSQIRKNTLFLK